MLKKWWYICPVGEYGSSKATLIHFKSYSKRLLDEGKINERVINTADNNIYTLIDHHLYRHDGN